MNKLFTVIILFINSSFSYSQCIVDKDKAIQIAMENGLEKGIDSMQVRRINDTIWKVECLICDENYTDLKNYIYVNCLTGQLATKFISLGLSVHDQYGELPRKYSHFDFGIDNIPIQDKIDKPYILNRPEIERVQNITISDNNVIAFSYGFRKIAIINIDGSGFKQICDECLYPQWIDNNNLAYYKDFEKICQSNIRTLKTKIISPEKENYTQYSISPNKKWLAYIKPPPHPEFDSLGRIIAYTHTCTDAEENDLWIMNVLNPSIQKKVNLRSNDIYNPMWTKNSDSLLFYVGDSVYYCTDINSIHLKILAFPKLNDISLLNYKKLRNGYFPATKGCKIVSVDYLNKKTAKILVNERGRYKECLFSKELDYLIYTKDEQGNGETKIWVLKL